MNWLQVLAVLQAGIFGVLGLLWADFRKHREAYASAKGTNLATKEDIGEITRRIESVKAELVLNAEVRKQVAAEKVKGLLRLADAARVVGEDPYGLSDDDSGKREAAIKAYWQAFRGVLVLIDRETLTRAEAFGREASTLWSAILTRKEAPASVRAPDLMALHNRGEISRDCLLEAIRVELRLAEEGLPFGRSGEAAAQLTQGAKSKTAEAARQAKAAKETA